MALKIKIARNTKGTSLVRRLLLFGLAVIALVVLVGFSIFEFTYFKYRGVVDQRFQQPVFVDTAKIFAAPREVRPGQKLSVNLIANELREAGYTVEGASPESQLGTYKLGAQSITMYPGPQSYHAPDSATIHVSN